jgi:hypothetical protein
MITCFLTISKKIVFDAIVVNISILCRGERLACLPILLGCCDLLLALGQVCGYQRLTGSAGLGQQAVENLDGIVMASAQVRGPRSRRCAVTTLTKHVPTTVALYTTAGRPSIRRVP